MKLVLSKQTKNLISLLFLTFSIMTSGCRTYHINVNGYLDPENEKIVEPGSSIFVIGSKEVKNPIFDKEVKNKIEKLLALKGFDIKDSEEADFFLIYSYGIDNGTTKTGALPVYQSGGTATVNTFGSSGYSHSMVQLPGSTTYVPYSRTLYGRWLLLNVIDAQRYRRTEEINSTWVGEMSSSGSNSDLREVVNYLLVVAFDHFGEDTGKQIKKTILSTDERAINLIKPSESNLNR